MHCGKVPFFGKPKKGKKAKSAKSAARHEQQFLEEMAEYEAILAEEDKDVQRHSRGRGHQCMEPTSLIGARRRSPNGPSHQCMVI